MTEHTFRQVRVLPGDTVDLDSRATDIKYLPQDDGSTIICWLEKTGESVRNFS